MKITEQQIECLDTLVVERLCSHKVDNLALVERFSNPRNNVLVDIIKSQKAINRDEANTIAYYVVKTKDGKLLAYFSLKCGELYEAYAQKEAIETQYWLRVLYGSKLINKEKYDELLVDLNELMRIITASIKTVKIQINHQ